MSFTGFKKASRAEWLDETDHRRRSLGPHVPTILTRLDDGRWHWHAQDEACGGGSSLLVWASDARADTDLRIEVGEDH